MNNEELMDEANYKEGIKQNLQLIVKYLFNSCYAYSKKLN